MKAREFKEGIFSMGAVDWDRRLFDALIPLPDGTSYNAYLVRGSEKTALLDTVDPTKSDTLMKQLNDFPRVDYVIAHHAEQDHSGALPLVMERYPQAQLLTSPKGKDMLVDLLPLAPDRIETMEDGQAISLGDRTLEFIHTPWVHWPETISTYLPEERILFSCDFFGSHLATSEVFVTDEAHVLEAAKRYYAEIMMPFRKAIAKNLEKLHDKDIEIIAPSHGPIYAKPMLILEAYQEWVSDETKNIALIPYVSMHDSTRLMVEALLSGLVARGVEVKQFDLPVTDIGKLAMALVDATSVIFATPMVLAGPHPAAVYAAYLANILRPKTKIAGVMYSYGWGGKLVETIAGLTGNLKVEMLEPVVSKGLPDADVFAAVEGLADAVAAKHRELGVM
jgi:flavorubredoxin